MPALRLVEMLTARALPEPPAWVTDVRPPTPDETDLANGGPGEVVQRDWTAPPPNLPSPPDDRPPHAIHPDRLCHVCAAPRSRFGFGPPLTRAGVTLWACRAHREEVALLLDGTVRSVDGVSPPLLL